ncbi:hypothetical protein [Clostridium sp. BJN0013]|jgi:hypothetical protein
MRDKKFVKLQKENKNLKALLEESFDFIEFYRERARYLEGVYKQLDIKKD